MATKERLIIESLFRVANKDGEDVDFMLNSAQSQLDNELSGRDIIPKARQEGVSTYYLARYTAVCLHRRNSRAVVISHDTESTQRMLAKVHYFLENIRGPKAVIKTSNKNEITFAKTNSVFYIGTAGSRKFGRGDTISHLHCSEYAYWPNPEDLLAGLFQAVPKNGEIGIESTGKGIGNDYHIRCMRAASGQSRFKLHFLPWHEFPEYSYDVSPELANALMNNLNEDWEEPELIERFGLTAGQIAWRRDKLEEMNFDMRLFQQEYPSTLDECFQSTGHSIFHKIVYRPTKDWERKGAGFFVLRGHPNPYSAYVLGCDVGAGVGSDNSVVQVICLNTMEQVAELATNRIGPDVFGYKIAEIGKTFNNAYVCVESNNHGIVTLHELKSQYPVSKIHSAYKSTKRKTRDESLINLGVSTTSRSKPLMIGNLRHILADGLVIHGELTNNELNTFIETETGALEGDNNCLDDRVMALAVGCSGINQASLFANSKEDKKVEKTNPFLLDNIINDLQKSRGAFPISSQHKGVEV